MTVAAAASRAPEPVIVAARRSPVGRAFKGSLREVRPDALLAAVIKAALADLPADVAGTIDDVIIGCAQPAGEAGFNIGRVSALLAGLSAPGVTVNRYCASSLQSLRMAAHAISDGDGDVYLAGGVETVSRYRDGGADSGPANPDLAAGAGHTAQCAADDFDWSPGTSLPDVYIAMGTTAEFVRRREGVTRREMDEFAALSHARTVAAQREGYFDAEITPIELRDGSFVTRDDCPREGTTVERLAELKPAFHADGEVTAGNSCPLNDGAAAVVVMERTRAESLGLRPLARIVDSAVAAVEPELMGLGPVPATTRLLERRGLAMSDIDLVEINEAFAAQVIPSARLLGIDVGKLNTRGGAIALGHPFGMSGARLVMTLLNALARDDKSLGLATMCIGGGQGMALLLERLS
ncbi:MAG TPA: acetyl-CoA C-acyltransferase [Streptosporangiaceae bacterium]|nr:acetyl-CoA C-acyltransferase [Streptosporangiaceae bacterium]